MVIHTRPDHRPAPPPIDQGGEGTGWEEWDGEVRTSAAPVSPVVQTDVGRMAVGLAWLTIAVMLAPLAAIACVALVVGLAFGILAAIELGPGAVAWTAGEMGRILGAR